MHDSMTHTQRQAGAEIEITQEMVDAAKAELLESGVLWYEGCANDGMVRTVLSAALAASRKSQNRNPISRGLAYGRRRLAALGLRWKDEKDPQQKREDEVLRRRLNTPPKPHKPKGEGEKPSKKPGN